MAMPKWLFIVVHLMPHILEGLAKMFHSEGDCENDKSGDGASGRDAESCDEV